MRNKHGNEQKQRELSQLERKIADLINEGFLTEYNAVINYLRKLYRNKKN
jgi:flagellar motor switch protein FliM